MTSRDAALELLDALVAKYRGRRDLLHSSNEANTRLLLIDEILLILGWDKQDFRPETHAGRAGYLDYHLCVEGMPGLIVEAKRAGSTFMSQKGSYHRSEYKNNYLYTAFGNPVREVINQARDYAVEKRVPYAVITNGSHWLVIQLFSPRNIRWQELKCIYFGDVFDPENRNFNQMWELISKLAYQGGALDEAMSSINSFESEFAKVPRATLGDIAWNLFSSSGDAYLLKKFYNRFFRAIIGPAREQMMDFCFVSTSSTDQYRRELGMAIRDDAPIYVERASELSLRDAGHPPFLQDSEDAKGKVVLIVGMVGAGKSTFAAKVQRENQKNAKVWFLRISLENEVFMGEKETFDALWSMLGKAWRGDPRLTTFAEYDHLVDIFQPEINRIRTGPYARSSAEVIQQKIAERLDALESDAQTFTDRSVRYVSKARGVRIVVVFDNADRASDDFQRVAYAMAHKFAESGATVIFTMRESTYYRAKSTGFLDVRSDDIVYHLSAPDVRSVIARRIDYVTKKMDQDDRLTRWQTEDSWAHFRARSLEFAATLERQLLCDASGQSMIEMMAAHAWHNIREFNEQLTTVHERMLSLDARERWRPYHVVASLLVDEQSNLTCNIFRAVTERHRCTFCKLRVLLFLLVGVNQSDRRNGVTYSRIWEFARRYGYRKSWVNESVRELVADRVVECLEVPSHSDYTAAYQVEVGHSFRASPLGAKLVQDVIPTRTYLLLCGWDMYFHDKDAYDDFIAAFKNMWNTLEEFRIDAGWAETLERSELGRAVANNLITAYRLEAPQNPSDLREMSAVEVRLETIMRELAAACGILHPKLEDPARELDRSAPLAAEEPRNLELFASTVKSVDNLDGWVVIGIPDQIHAARIERSSTLPLVLWALVQALANGREHLNGVEITRIINYWLIEDSRTLLAAPNVSKTLRGKTARAVGWMDKAGADFRLAGAWRADWEELFGEKITEQRSRPAR